jgi:hypothetical protein
MYQIILDDGSGPGSLTNGSGSWSSHQYPSRHQQIFFNIVFFAYYFLNVHTHHSSKIKSHKEVT